MGNTEYQLIIAGAGVAIVGKIVWDWLSKRNGNGKKCSLHGRQENMLEDLHKWHFGAHSGDGTMRPAEVRSAIIEELSTVLVSLNKLIEQLKNRPCLMRED